MNRLLHVVWPDDEREEHESCFPSVHERVEAMEAVLRWLGSGDLPVRFLRLGNPNGECPCLVFELTESATIEETICLARRMARLLTESNFFSGGFCLEIVLQVD